MSRTVVSVVICTRNRAPQLDRSLRSVARLDLAEPWELILVDNGSSDATSAVLDEFAGVFDGRLRVVCEPRPGLAHARNRGLREAAGDVVAFTDDDCYPDPRWLAWIHRRFADEPALGFLGGQIRLHDPADLPMTILLVEEREEFAPPAFIRPGEVQGANMAFRRAALEEVGGFDIRLGAGTSFACEDIDAVARVSSAGWLGAYDPRPIVYHHHGRQERREVEALFRYYLHGAGAYYVKCLADPRLRGACARHWFRRRLPSPRAALLELSGAAHFALAVGAASLSARLRRASALP